MSKGTKVHPGSPVAEPEPEVLAFRAQFDARSPLDQIIHDGAQRMLQSAIEAEVDEFLLTHDNLRDENGNRLVVRNGRQPARQILTGAGRLEVHQPRVRDKSKPSEERVTFTSKILPPYLRRSKTIDELIPWLYLKGVSTSDFPEALQALLGEDAKGLSPNVTLRVLALHLLGCRNDICRIHRYVEGHQMGMVDCLLRNRSVLHSECCQRHDGESVAGRPFGNDLCINGLHEIRCPCIGCCVCIGILATYECPQVLPSETSG